MRRTLFTLAAGVSAVLCVAVCVLWVRSEWVTDYLLRVTDEGSIGCTSSAGRIMFRREPRVGGVDVRPGLYRRQFRPVTWYTPQFRLAWHPAFVLILPYWFVASVGLMTPACWLALTVRRSRQMDRQRNHRCPACGYDLRATPDRCPECGAGRAAKGEKA